MTEEALPDILALFLKFDETYFDSQLRKDCFVEWSTRMFVCAGICSHGSGETFCTIRLSKPLLKLRPRSDLVETLLHEMIHAFLFIKERNYDRDGHGPQFHSHMHRINRKGGYNISVYHEFHDEVDFFKTHVWRCEGICQNKYPYFGYVKRTANRPPGPNDLWWPKHQLNCAGEFKKIKEPKDYVPKKKSVKKEGSNQPKVTIDTFFKKQKVKKTIEPKKEVMVLKRVKKQPPPKITLDDFFKKST